MTDTFTLKTHILHTCVYRNGELYCILPPGSLNWLALMAEVITDAEPPF